MKLYGINKLILFICIVELELSDDKNQMQVLFARDVDTRYIYIGILDTDIVLGSELKRNI
jgi:hypothetical protein